MGAGRLSLLSFIQAFSIDAVVAALAMAALVNHMTATDVHYLYWPTLGLAIWSVYTVDHLADAITAGRRAVSLRHRVHLHRRKLLTVLMGTAAVLAFGLAIAALPPRLVLGGIWLAVATALYFVLLLFRSDKNMSLFIKEPIVAAIFTTGIWLAPLTLSSDLNISAILIMILMWMTVFSNLLMNSLLDVKEDRSSGFFSLSLKYGEKGTLITFISLMIASLAITAFLASTQKNDLINAAALIFFGIELIFLVMLLFRKRVNSSLLRLLGDGVFLFCLLILLLT